MKCFWILLEIIAFGSTQVEGNLDPCFNFTHLYEMEKRYASYKADVHNGEAEICDQYLIPNKGEWYYSEEDMPVTAPPLYRCGTSFPIWLAGSIPELDDGIVNRTACLSASFSDCDKTYNIRIKACAGYSVYFLIPSTGCPEAYCFGNGSSESPPTNKTPTPVVKFYEVKVETRPEVFQDRLEFECFIGAKENLHYPFYQISWLRDGVSVYTRTEPVTNLVGLRLTEDRTKPFYFDSLGVTLSCISRAKNAAKGQPGPLSKSDSFFAGVVLEKSVVDLAEDKSTHVNFYPTVPFGCGYDQNLWTACYLTVQMYVQKNDKCEGSVTADKDAKNCFKRIYRSKEVWNETQSINIQYQRRGTYNVGKGETFVIQLIAKSGHHQLWLSYILPLIYVTIHDNKNTVWKGRICSSKNDPHMTTFDGRKYENHNAGTYILYEHYDSLRPMQVQIKLRNCNRHGIFCNCGVAVRAGGDVFVIDLCFDKRIMQYMTCHDRILDVRRYNKNTRNYNIFFPTGTEVQINVYYSHIYKEYTLNVHVTASMHDTEKTKGLCGFLSGTCTDDFVKSDSSYSTTANANKECASHMSFNSLYPDDFSLSWSVNDSFSLFELAVNQNISKWKDDNRYCTCPAREDQTSDPLDFECAPGSVTTCERDKNYKELRTGTCQVLSGQKNMPRARMSSVYYPWTSYQKRRKHRSNDKIDLYSNVSMTFEDALEYCRNTIGNTTAFKACSGVPNVPTEDALEICAIDITLTNSFEWVEETLETLKTGCIIELQKNDSLHLSVGNGTEASIADQIESIICPGLPECSGKGECVNGTCKCQQGYIEVDCSMDLSSPPELYGIRGEGFCDMNEIACDTSFLVGNGMSYSRDLACKVHDFLILRNGEKHYMTEYIVDGILETIVEVYCPVHRVQNATKSRSFLQDQVFVEGHSISVSYDRINFGDKHDMYVYDSICQDPDAAADPPKFALLANTCFIEGRCLLHGDYNVSNKCLKCNSSSPYEWSIDSRISGCAVKPTKYTDADTDVMVIAGPVIGAIFGILVILSSAIIIRKFKSQTKKMAIHCSTTNTNENQNYSLSSTSFDFEGGSIPRNTQQ